jgi:hypothetical protein
MNRKSIECPRAEILFGWGCVLMLLLLILIPKAMSATETQRRIEEEIRQELEQTELEVSEGKRGLVFDYGGWFNVRYLDYDEDDNDSSTPDTIDYTSFVDLRFWLKATLRPPLEASYENEHSLYLRLKDLYSENRPVHTAGGCDHDGPELDYAYLILDLRPYWLKIGRRYFSVGQGIAYSNVNDGIEFDLRFSNWGLKAFGSQTLANEENIDMSVPGYEKESNRYYYGLEYSYLGLPQQIFYAYALIQRDYSEEIPEDVNHDYDYDSEYLGLGAQGKLKSAFSYWAEIIRQTGQSLVYDNNEKRDIDAWGSAVGVTYESDFYMHPSVTFEYAFGSGDKDRTSVTNTQNGNTSGRDKNFLYFGYIPTGYALSPRLSNLHLYRLGIRLNPLEKITLFRNFTLGIDYYRYYKDEKRGGIYDPEASEDNDNIGSEIDVNAVWQILSDLRFTIQYGHFIPGDAYSVNSNDSEDYFSISAVLMF